MSGSEIEVVLSGVSFSKLKKVIKSFRGVLGVTEVIQRSFDAPMAVLTVTTLEDTMQLAENLDRKKIAGFTLEILSVSSGKMNVKVR